MSRDSGRSRAGDIVDRFLAEAGQRTTGLQIQGAAGIGKTTTGLEALATARARGFRVLGSRVGRPETGLGYAVLGDLLESVPDEELTTLPAPQRDALAAALLRSPAAEPVQDPRAVSLATLAVVRRMAADGPLVIAMDDIQWVDASSARVIGFVLQRLDAEPVGVLATRRTGETAKAPLDLEHAMAPGRLSRLELGPMEPNRFGQLLRARVDALLPHSVVAHIHELVEGNPFFGLEMAREVVRRGVPGPGEPLPVDGDAFALVRDRVQALPAETRAVLTPAALTYRPAVQTLRRALPGKDVEAALARAESEGLVLIRQGDVSFTHPIFASALTATTSPVDLRVAHSRLAAVLESPEQHARHLALSSLEPDERVAEALDRAHESARRRGAAAAAAELAQMALSLTPWQVAAQRTRRGVVAGMLAFEAGDARQAHDLLNRTLEATHSGRVRAEVMVTLCEICWQDTVEVEALASAALAEPAVEPLTAAAAHLMLAWVWIYRGDLARADGHRTSAGELVGPEAPAADRSDFLTVAALISFLTGEPHEELVEEAVALEERLDPAAPADSSTIYSGARVTQGLMRVWAGDLDRAAAALEKELARLESRGRYVARDEVLCYLAHLECRRGNWADAERYADECLEIGEDSGHLRGRGQNIVPRAWVSALRGDLEGARRDAEEGLTLSTRFVDRLAMANCRGVLGLVDLSAGDPEAAAQHLSHVLDFLRGSGIAQPETVPFVADALEALVAAGRVVEAEAAARDDRMMGRVEPGARPAVTLVRGAAAVAAARGDLPSASSMLEDALCDDRLRARPFEHARTLLVAAEIERRRRRRPQARAFLEEALATFRLLGAEVWASRTSTELGRLQAAAADELTPAEEQLAALVARGLTNREAAEHLFVSVKTVEANLSRIYRKLGVRSRAELVRRRLTEAGSGTS